MVHTFFVEHHVSIWHAGYKGTKADGLLWRRVNTGQWVLKVHGGHSKLYLTELTRAGGQQTTMVILSVHQIYYRRKTSGKKALITFSHEQSKVWTHTTFQLDDAALFRKPKVLDL